ncbi:solute carrier family 10 (sodium/bile acid cotransporter), member 7 [Paraoerskovia marina]|uniref:Solute carrier family 10 (Sodium/bile acid cotransporter), member 7 n=1 Tax=Paraoerskovia marina TaxID=545619 RepID=A0A1H1UU06_9CELL|nr:bile acid:sodium symporter family protein [Paraoerskovia marina]SDS75790.1 solute carrier family 10 (sodium/bile acid cotransporter), member 7 [Paraoerskovia marina]
MQNIWRRVDPFVAAILTSLALGLLLPVPDTARGVVDGVSTAAVALLFFVYGARLPSREVWDGLRNWRLQGGILASTWLVFPVLGLVTAWLVEPALGAGLAGGILYVSLLPSTVQASVAFTSVAHGNVAGAVCGATVSNLLGMVLTPLLVLWLMGAETAGLGMSGIGDVLLHLLLPFVLGQLVQPLIGAWIRARRWISVYVDRGAIVLIVFSSVSGAASEGAFGAVSAWALAGLLLVSAAMLAIMLAVTWFGGRALGLDRADRVALLMCGSKKSLATGLPMASVLFPVAVAGTVAVPLIVFHQLQLIVCAMIAQRLARTAPA